MRKPAGCRFTVRVTDDLIPQNNGVWKVTDHSVTPTDREPDLTVSEKALGQLVCGAVSLTEALYRDDTSVAGNQQLLESIFVRRPILVEEYF